MRPVRVDLHEVVVACAEPVAETGEVGAPEAFLSRPVQHRDAAVGGGELVGDAPRAIRTAVVDDEHVRRRHVLAQPPHERAQALRFVVGGDDDERVSHDAPPRGRVG